jgi:hypothetical protein
MLEFLRGRMSDRKLRLFACGVVRGHYSLEDARSRGVVEVAERFADGVATEQERKTAQEQAGHTIYPDCSDVNCVALYSVEKGEELLANLVGVARIETGRLGSSVQLWKNMGDLLLDIFGNPFHPAQIDPAWLRWHEGLLVSMARQMYESRDFTHMPILTDALEEASCNNADILIHCRQPGEHVRGCWIVDLLLGKEWMAMTIR